MEYNSFSYLYPPRPDEKVPQGALGGFERRGWQAQIKKNGTCTVIFARGDEVIFKTRHCQEQLSGDDHKMWSPKPEHVNFFRGSDRWNVFTAELLHSKTPHIKDFLYIFDVIVLDGQQLVGTTFAERQAMLRALYPHHADDASQLGIRRVAPNVALAKNYKAGFVKLFDSLKPEDEGLVLKDPTAKLLPCFKEGSNNRWQVKSRVPHKNYSF